MKFPFVTILWANLWGLNKVKIFSLLKTIGNKLLNLNARLNKRFGKLLNFFDRPTWDDYNRRVRMYNSLYDQFQLEVAEKIRLQDALRLLRLQDTTAPPPPAIATRSAIPAQSSQRTIADQMQNMSQNAPSTIAMVDPPVVQSSVTQEKDKVIETQTNEKAEDTAVGALNLNDLYWD